MSRKSAHSKEAKISSLDLLQALQALDTSHEEMLVLTAQIGSIARRKGKCILVLPEYVCMDDLTEAFQMLRHVTDANGVPHPERLPPLVRSKVAKVRKAGASFG